MLRAFFLAACLLVSAAAATAGQELSVLHITVTLVEADGKATPVPRHLLLVSDNPPSAPPRRIFTRADGTADVRLRPGNYTVESDQPVAFHSQAFQWTRIVDVVAGRDAALALTNDNAEVGPITPEMTTSTQPLERDPLFLLPQWRDSVVAVWTPKTHASGFVVDARGLIVTNQRGIDGAAAVEVQITQELKVAANVLAVDPVRDVAVLWIDPKALTAIRPVPLGCTSTAALPVVNGQELFTIGAPLRQQKRMTSGTVSRVDTHVIAADLSLASGSAGGPVFTAGGEVVGMTSVSDGDDRRNGTLVARTADACDLIASAEKAMIDAAPPAAAHRPVDPLRAIPVDVLKEAAQRRVGSLSPYQMSSSAFDVAFITPVLAYGARDQARGRDGGSEVGRDGSRDRRGPGAEPGFMRALTDFGNWAEYVADFPPVLLVRVTPKLVERFWTTVARSAARTQGVDLPPVKRVKAGFLRMRAFCGDDEVMPIHAFTLEQRVSESEAIDKGLYAFDPGALGPQCGTVRLILFSEKEPAKGDTRTVDPKVLQQIWEDFTPYRALSAASW